MLAVSSCRLPATRRSCPMSIFWFRLVVACARQPSLAALGCANACMSKDTGALCNILLDLRGRHGRICPVGGGVVERHNRIRDCLAKWIAQRVERNVLTEQYVPHWDRIRGDAIDGVRLDWRTTIPTVGVYMPPFRLPRLQRRARRSAASLRQERVPQLSGRKAIRISATLAPVWLLLCWNRWAVLAEVLVRC